MGQLGRLSFQNGRGVRVTLTTDVTQHRRDRYGRLLAYITRRDGRNLGEAQLRAGWAKVYVTSSGRSSSSAALR